MKESGRRGPRAGGAGKSSALAVVACALAVGIAAYAFAAARDDPEARTASTVVSFNDPGLMNYERSVVAPAENTVVDTNALEEAASDLPGTATGALRAQIELIPDAALQTVSVRARAESAQEAVRVADVFARAYVEARRAAIREAAQADRRAAEEDLASADSPEAREDAQVRRRESDLVIAWVDAENPRPVRRATPVSTGGTATAIRGAGIAAFVGLVLAAGLVWLLPGGGGEGRRDGPPQGEGSGEGAS